MTVVEFAGEFPGTAQEVFQWHANPGAFDRLNPPWDSVEIVKPISSLESGSTGALKMKLGPIPLTWNVEHVEYQPPELFSDRQTKGPFKSWHHFHHFEEVDSATTRIRDEIHFTAPFGALSNSFIHSKLERLFKYRHQQCRIDLIRHQAFKGQNKLRVAISGASGLVGQQLTCFLSTGGHEVLQLVRRPAFKPNEISWDPVRGVIEHEKLEGLDAVIHLAGANIGDGRWNERRKKILTSSRVDSTSLLANTLASLKDPPKTFISMSGAGRYGFQDYETIFSESDEAAKDFLAQLTVDWEQSTSAASQAGIRTVILRAPVVLTARGGALTKMLPPFFMGAGGKIGSGKQPMSWVALDDLLGIFLHAIQTPSLSGPVNVNAPTVPTNLEFTKTLGRVIKRPTIAPLPGFVVTTLFGEMGQALLLGGQRLDSNKLLQSGFEFMWPDLESALRHELGRTL